MKAKYIFSLRSISAFVIVVMFSLSACKKQDEFLSAIPDSRLAVPATLNDLQLLCQYDLLWNASEPYMLPISAENVFISDTYLSTIDNFAQNAYKWEKVIFPSQMAVGDWNNPYKMIQTANIILESLAKIDVSNTDKPKADAIKGTALFYRSWAYFNLLREFSLPYDSATAATQLGVPIRSNSAIEIKSVRQNEKEGYDLVVSDLTTAIGLLPAKTSQFTLPTVNAAKGFLSRVYLSLGNYSKAFEYADKFLNEFNQLTDFNSITSTGSNSVSTDYLVEDVYHCVMPTSLISLPGSSQIQIDSAFLASYDSTDLRRTLYFALRVVTPPPSRWYFKGSYESKKGALYGGIATDEILLNRAECYARMGNNAAALNDLNSLLTKRYKTGTFSPYTTANTANPLLLILRERNKELFMRGLRWSDLRRLNKDPQFAVTLTRKVAGVTYTLSPNDPKYALPIPDNEILLSGIQQNLR